MAAQAPFEHQEFCLNEREVLALQHWAAKEGVSLASLLLTSFTVLLRRYQSLGGMYHFIHISNLCVMGIALPVYFSSIFASFLPFSTYR